MVCTLLVPVVVEKKTEIFKGGEICLTDLVEVLDLVEGEVEDLEEVWGLDFEAALHHGLI